MEALIEIIIRVIANLFENRAVKQPQRMSTPPGYQGTPPPPGRIEPPNRATVTRQMPPARRTTRRPPPVPIALARPILTGRSPTRLAPEPTLAPAPTPPLAPMTVARAVSHTSIVAPNTIAPQSAAAIRKWLTPATLKQQFLLTEILQRPLALRERGENR